MILQDAHYKVTRHGDVINIAKPAENVNPKTVALTDKTRLANKRSERKGTA